MIEDLLSYVAPHLCYGCGETGSALCSYCSDDISSEPFTACVGCLLPCAGGGNLCRMCLTGSEFAGAWCAGTRDGLLRTVVNDYKFSAVRELARPLGVLLEQSLPRLTGVTIVTIPTARRHIRTLGYDHAALLGRTVAGIRSLPVATPLERRSQEIQHGLSRRARLRQAADMFTTRDRVSGDVLLVDDIYTTGTTLSAAARELKRAGARRVYVAVLARQPLD